LTRRQIMFVFTRHFTTVTACAVLVIYHKTILWHSGTLLSSRVYLCGKTFV
jgi:hypothetical protein